MNAARLRIARPVTDLARAQAMYMRGLGLTLLARFENHEGFDGVILGVPGADYHLEFTQCRHHPIAPRTTVEDLLVLYLPDAAEWRAACARMQDAGFAEVAAFNPWWDRGGRSFEDADGYRTVLCNAAWAPQLEGDPT
ncbi:MAG TPA: VOC family protein [Burkholderiaceae bacterium]|nr:VOC family protein [Burkholderiaceae bacterium]